MPLTPQQLADIALGALGQDADTGHVVLRPEGLQRLAQGLSEVPPGAPLVEAIRYLTAVAGHIIQEYGAEDTARELMEVVEGFAVPEVRRRIDAKVEKTSERVDAVGKKFDDFQGSKGEKLPDTGERIDPSTLKKGPIRG